MDLPFVRTFIERSLVDSTSDRAREILSAETPPLPLLVVAERQTKGRGRGANQWWSDEGSLTFTLAIDPKSHGLTVEHQPRIALAMAVAIVNALLPVAQGLSIRWPNDVEVGRAQLSPPLCEGGLGGVDAAEPEALTAPRARPLADRIQRPRQVHPP